MQSSGARVHLLLLVVIAVHLFSGCAVRQASGSDPGETPGEPEFGEVASAGSEQESAEFRGRIDGQVRSALFLLEEAGLASQQGDSDGARQTLQECLSDLHQFREYFPVFPSLEDAYHRVLKELLTLEIQEAADLTALQPTGVELSPLDYIGALDLQDFRVDAELEAMAARDLQRREWSFPFSVNDTVLKAVRFYQGPGRRIMESGLRRSGKYLPYFLQVFRKEGIPEDLVYMAHVESLFQPQAYSRARARGIWQFMEDTGRLYGLNVNWWVDERLHLEKSTEAAAKHLKDLHEEFQDWLLALAAYNAGPGRIRRNLKQYGEMDFWAMADRRLLPRETRNHVPSILAAILIFRNPEHYGFSVEPEPRLLFEKARVDYQVDLRVVAEELDLPLEVLRDLNPALRRDVTPFGEDRFELKVPPGKGTLLETVLAELPPEKRLRWRHHRVRKGETLSGIATEYRTSIRAIAEVNRIRNINRLSLGQDLVIPLGAGAAWSRTGDGRDFETDNHIVNRGDSLYRIARRYGVSVDDLARLNNLRPSDTIYPGQKLKIRSSMPSGQASRN